MTTFAMARLGCKVNTYEAESIATALKSRGMVEVDFKEKADVYCIFTCAVTNTAASKSRQKIHQARRQNKEALVCAVGCYVQVNAESMTQDEQIDILVGSQGKKDIPDLIEANLKKREHTVLLNDVRKEASFELLPLESFSHMTRAYLKVQDGCNQFCSYCIIPYARGKERSIELSEAISQAKELARHHEEIVLAGIHTGRYGKEEGVSLVQLIQGILDHTSIRRVRISSIEITEITDDLIELMKTDCRVAKHLHIPLQSGCNSTLKRMNRPYTTEEFFERVQWIRKEVPGISISTDLIVGFVGETEEEYELTRRFLWDVRFSFIHVFPFSSKSGTVASRMKEHIASDIKKARTKEVLNISKNLKTEYMSTFIGKEVEVLIEKAWENGCMGHTSEYIEVQLNQRIEPGTLVKAIGIAINEDKLYGKGVDQDEIITNV